jgi:2'-hydroxyisoflavone reductase
MRRTRVGALSLRVRSVVAAFAAISLSWRSVERERVRMRMLILGGTSFVGRSIAEAAIGAGHDVVFANRGRTNAFLFPNHRHVAFDRDGDASVLEGIDVDVVIDTCGYTPDAVERSARALAARIRTYVFVSSIDAYDLRELHPSETTPSKILEPGASTSERLPELYGPHKVRCEQLLVEMLGAQRVLVVRAGLMVGPHDYTDRFTYWPVRIARGGDVLVPIGRDMPVQFIDVRDVADWTIRALERNIHGLFGVTGAPGATTFGDVIDACAEHAATPPRFHWASDDFLVEHGVEPWTELPLWLPPDPAYAGLRNVRTDRAWANGLRCRPLASTVSDVLAEFAARPAGTPLRAGLSAEREARLIVELTRR